MMSVPFIFIIISVGCAALIGYLAWLDNRHLRRLRFRVKKLYASPMFAKMVPFLRVAQRNPIEQLTIDKTGVTVRYLEPAGSESRFILRAHGFGHLHPEKQEALLALLEEFLPKMTDPHRYFFRKRRVRLVNGQTEIYYEYIIQNHYKTHLIRAPYYSRSVQQLR